MRGRIQVCLDRGCWYPVRLRHVRGSVRQMLSLSKTTNIWSTAARCCHANRRAPLLGRPRRDQGIVDPWAKVVESIESGSSRLTWLSSIMQACISALSTHAYTDKPRMRQCSRRLTQWLVTPSVNQCTYDRVCLYVYDQITFSAFFCADHCNINR